MSQTPDKSPIKSDGPTPDMFICPISMEIMKDPQISKCGHMFDRTSIVKWLKGEYDPGKQEIKRGCPVCNKEMDLQSLGPCYPIKKAIEDYLKTVEPQNQFTSSSTTGSNQSLSSQQSGLSYESTTTQNIATSDGITPTDDHRPRSASSISRFKDNILRKISGDSSKKSKRKVWCVLTPVVIGMFDKIHVFLDDFQIGRNPGADQVIKLQEVSHFHCRIKRRELASGKYEVIIEDGSTNGTFINGEKVGKTNLNSAFHGDCLSIGRKFSVEKDIPLLDAWIDWVFAGSSDLQDNTEDIEKLKAVDRFDTLLQFHDADFNKLGVNSESVINTVSLALKAWKYDHRFPGTSLFI